MGQFLRNPPGRQGQAGAQRSKFQRVNFLGTFLAPVGWRAREGLLRTGYPYYIYIYSPAVSQEILIFLRVPKFLTII